MIADPGRGPAPVGDLSNRALLGLVSAALVALVVYAAVRPWLPLPWRTPGSPPLYLTGVAGALLLLVSAAFSGVKRAGLGGSPRRWFQAHIVTGLIGMILVAIHGAGQLGRPPALLYPALVALAIVGVWARVRLNRAMAATFGTRYPAFLAAPGPARERLRALIEEKRRLLDRLDPAAQEGTFAPTLAHWLRHPRLSAAYARLAREESLLIGAQRVTPPPLAWWRRVHIALGVAFIAGLALHVVVVTFFAGYAAGGREITWCHVTAW